MSRSHHRTFPLTLATGAVLLAAPVLATPAAPGPQGANAVPLPVTAGNKCTEGEPLNPGQIQWYKVALTKGHDYAFWAAVNSTLRSGPTVTVYGPTGKRLLSFGNGNVVTPAGSELRAPSTGTYKLAATDVTFTYCIGVELDCRQGPTTRCGLAVGRKSRGYFAFDGDSDWRRIAVQEGRHYSLLLRGYGESTADAAVIDRQGKVVASCSAGEQAQQPCLGFTAAYSGRYYVSVDAGPEEPFYDIGLTSP